MAAKYSNTYVLNTNIAQVCTIVRDPGFWSALGLNFKHENSVQSGTFFSFSKSVNFASWGENVDVSVIYQSDSSTQVIIKSECSLPTQVIDWGKNKENVEKFYNQLSVRLGYNPGFVPAQQAPEFTPVPNPAPVQQAPEFTPVPNPAPVQQAPEFTPVPNPAPVPEQQPQVSAFCRSCGTKLVPDSRFCHICGTPVV